MSGRDELRVTSGLQALITWQDEGDSIDLRWDGGKMMSFVATLLTLTPSRQTIEVPDDQVETRV